MSTYFKTEKNYIKRQKFYDSNNSARDIAQSNVLFMALEYPYNISPLSKVNSEVEAEGTPLIIVMFNKS